MMQYIEEEYKVQGGLEYKPKMDDKEWISKSWVGTLHGYEEVEDIQNIFCAAGFYQVKTVKLGGKEILLSPIDNTDLEQLFSKEVDWIDTHFESIKKCSPSTVARERVTWVKCIGIPLMAWEENMFKLIANLIDSDSEVDSSVAASVNRWAVEISERIVCGGRI
ncbi:hypothetical protein RIF29_27905 [Crotalaria pallida]|uniref:DUF4283 domain-containing protein n=1 Tax=Crotalaria pallida TaxID=3830 RepID=A0AAN9EQM3_CROPI